MSAQKVCFVALGAYPLFDAACALPFGGSELRAATFARRLAEDPAFEVDLVVFDHGQPRLEQHGRLRVHAHPHYRAARGTRASALVRSVGRRVRTAFATVRALDHVVDPAALAPYERLAPDVLCAFGVADLTAELAAYARSAGRKFVLFLGSDSDVSERYVPSNRERNDYGSRADLCHFAVMAADAIVAQTHTQHRLLRERFGREAAVIANPALGAPEPGPDALREHVLWVGKSDDVKRPELFVALARQRPGLKFVMVANNTNAARFAALAADLPSNVTLVERVEVEEGEALFKRSRALVNTSRFEGFPNTFLQAGVHGVPILSLGVDPDGMIARSGCGRVAGTVEELAAALDQACEPVTFARMSSAARAYVAANHDPAEKMRQLKALIGAVISRPAMETPKRMSA